MFRRQCGISVWNGVILSYLHILANLQSEIQMWFQSPVVATVSILQQKPTNLYHIYYGKVELWLGLAINRQEFLQVF